MHRDHGFHNILGTPDGAITKVIDWGEELCYEPLGLSLGRIETYVKDAVDLRKEFWHYFTDATKHFVPQFPNLWASMKTTKDVGFVVWTVGAYKDEGEVNGHQWSLLEDALLNDDCINELKEVHV